MGTVTTHSGTKISLAEVDGDFSLNELYKHVICDQYTDGYRERMIRAWSKLGRQGWGILPVLHELVKSKNTKLVTVAKEALKQIDPGAPSLSHTYSPQVSGTDCRSINKSTISDNRFPYQSANGQTVWKKPEIKQVTITDIPVNKDLSEGTRVTSICNFCEKPTIFTKDLRRISETLSGNKKLFCNFCLRHDFYKPRYLQNTLLVSFRSIIAYYYYCFYFVPKSPTMFVIDIEKYNELHAKMGTQNPLFRYDKESFLWFVDFSKVGTRRRQMPLKYILDTIVDILSSFNLYEHVKDCSPAQLFQKYKEAITDFHHHRRRPIDQRILIPTLYGCGIPHETSLGKSIPVNLLKNFMPQNLIENYKLKRNYGVYG